MNQKIDHDRVYWMLKTGFHPELIAQRLDASRRQIDRIIARHGWSGSRHLKDFSEEDDLKSFFRIYYGESFERIGQRFGVSRQAIQKYFSQLKSTAA